MTRLAVVTCLWKRPGLSGCVLDQYRGARERLKGQVDLELVAAGSEGDVSRDLAESRGWSYIEHDNTPLSFKWNAAVQAAREREVDGIIIVGSDDFLSDSLILYQKDRIEDGVEFSLFMDLFVMDAKSLACKYFRGRTGAGRCISSAALDRVKWRLWVRPVGSGLDSQMRNTLFKVVPGEKRKYSRFRDLPIEGSSVDVKTGTNITSFARVPGKPVEFDEVWKVFGEEGTKRVLEATSWLREKQKAASSP